MLRPDEGMSKSSLDLNLIRSTSSDTTSNRHPTMNFSFDNMFGPMMAQMFQAMRSAQTPCPSLKIIRTPRSTSDLAQMGHIVSAARPRVRICDAAPSTALLSAEGSELDIRPQQEQTQQLSIYPGRDSESSSQASNLDEQGRATKRSRPSVAAVVTALADRKREAAKAAAEARKKPTATTQAVQNEVKHDNETKHEEQKTHDDELKQLMDVEKKKMQRAKNTAAQREQVFQMISLSGDPAPWKEVATEPAAEVKSNKGQKRQKISDGESDTEVTLETESKLRRKASKKLPLAAVAIKEVPKPPKRSRPPEQVEAGSAQHKKALWTYYCNLYRLKGFLYVCYQGLA